MKNGRFMIGVVGILFSGFFVLPAEALTQGQGASEGSVSVTAKPSVEQAASVQGGISQTQALATPQKVMTKSEGALLFKQGIALGAERKYKEAVETIKKIVVSNKQDNLATLALKVFEDFDNKVIDEEVLHALCQGERCLLNNQAAEAISYFKKALELNPDYVEANITLGFAYYTLGQQKDAVIYLKKATQLDPKNLHFTIQGAYFMLGSSYVTLFQFQEARNAFGVLIPLLKKSGNVEMAKQIEEYVKKFPQ